MEIDEIELSSSVTVGRYKELETSNDRAAIAQFVRERFSERYFDPIDSAPLAKKHGFATMAVCCLVIETLESFYQGKGNTSGGTRKMFSNFFTRSTPLKEFGTDGDWFFRDIRCGILHQSETRGGWRIHRKGELLDKSEKTINASKFIGALRKAVEDYANQLSQDDDLWARFKEKMQAICDNCA